jgi:Fic family protein
MDYQSLVNKKEYINTNKHLLSEQIIDNYNNQFDVEYTHNSTAIEGNTLSLIETKMVLEENMSIGGKALREIYEVVNHNRAFQYIKECINKGLTLNEKIIKDIHALLMENIMVGGVYRSVDVYISGARHTPPTPNEMYHQIKNFYIDLSSENHHNAIELAAWTHAEFVKIHPFVDGNGRTARLIMNYQLMANGFLPISISKEERLNYFETLESYALDNDLSPFSKLIATLEEMQLNKWCRNIEATIQSTKQSDFEIKI